MKQLLLVLLILGVSVPAVGDVFVYNWIENKTGFELDGSTWEQIKDKPAGYNVVDVDNNEITIWSIVTWKGKDKNGKTQNFCELDFVESYELLQVQIENKQMWIIPAAGDAWRMLLMGEAKPNKISSSTIAAKLDGFAIVDEADGANREIRNVKTSFRLNSKMTLDCRGLTAEQAVERILGSLEIKGYIDCDANPCLCNAEWKFEPSMNIARDQFAGGVIDGKIYVFGGNGNPNGINLKSTGVFDPATGLWTMRADNEQNGGWGVEELTAAVMNGKLYVFGAWGGGSGIINFNEMYNPADNSWTTLAQKPTTVASAPAVVYNGEIYIFGGYYEDDTTDYIRYTVVESYNPSSYTWRTVTNLPKVMSNFAVAVIGTKAYLFGGAEGTEPPNVQLLDDVITYDFETKVWETASQHLPVKNAYGYWGEAPVIDGKVYLIGGIEKSGSKFGPGKRVDIYDTITNTWSQGPTLPKPLESHVAVVIDKKIYVLGGSHTITPSNVSLAEVISFDTQSCSP